MARRAEETGCRCRALWRLQGKWWLCEVCGARQRLASAKALADKLTPTQRYCDRHGQLVYTWAGRTQGSLPCPDCDLERRWLAAARRTRELEATMRRNGWLAADEAPVATRRAKP